MKLFSFGSPKRNKGLDSSQSSSLFPLDMHRSRSRSVTRFTTSAILACLIAACASSACLAQKAVTDLDLRGTVTYANHQTYLELPFNVPKGVSRVTVEFSYTGRDQHTTIDLGLFDNERFRGW
ncbi:MAG: hypothetical protein ABI158_07170, partial [Edaphobacter sp.]